MSNGFFWSGREVNMIWINIWYICTYIGELVRKKNLFQPIFFYEIHNRNKNDGEIDYIPCANSKQTRKINSVAVYWDRPSLFLNCVFIYPLISCNRIRSNDGRLSREISSYLLFIPVDEQSYSLSTGLCSLSPLPFSLPLSFSLTHCR